MHGIHSYLLPDLYVWTDEKAGKFSFALCMEIVVYI